MGSLSKYFELLKTHPELFDNPSGPNRLEIITDPLRIHAEQAKLRQELKEKGQPSTWIDVGVLVDDPWILVVRDLVKFPDGRVGGYLRTINRKSLEGGFNVIIFPMQSGKALLLNHFRHELRDWTWEFPRGFGEPGLSAEENAIKEVVEEIGIHPVSLTRIGSEREGANGGTVYFFAELPPDEKIVTDTTEGISHYSLVSLAELEAWISDGTLKDMFSVKAYALAMIKGLLPA